MNTDIDRLVNIISHITQGRSENNNNRNLLIQSTTINRNDILNNLDNIVQSYTDTLNERDANILNNVHTSFNNIINFHNNNDDITGREYINNITNSYNDNDDDDDDNDDNERLISLLTINNTLFNNYTDDSEDEDNDGTVYFNNFEDVPKILKYNEFSIFSKKTVTNRYISLLNTSKCTICLDNYVLKEKYITLLCNHNFHEKCIKKWLCEKSICCPICRMPQKKCV